MMGVGFARCGDNCGGLGTLLLWFGDKIYSGSRKLKQAANSRAHVAIFVRTGRIQYRFDTGAVAVNGVLGWS